MRTEYKDFANDLNKFVEDTKTEISDSSVIAAEQAFKSMAHSSPVYTGHYLSNLSMVTNNEPLPYTDIYKDDRGDLGFSEEMIELDAFLVSSEGWSPFKDIHRRNHHENKQYFYSRILGPLFERFSLKLGKKLDSITIGNTCEYALGVENGVRPAKREYRIFANGFEDLKRLWVLKQRK